MCETGVGSRLSKVARRLGPATFNLQPATGSALIRLRICRARIIRGPTTSSRLETVYVFALLSLFSTNLPAGPAEHPKRLINSNAVDLSPLFKWWTKHEGPRPLPSWVHVAGSITGTNAGGWVLEAEVEGADKGEGSARAGSAHEPLKIILVNPPVEDLADFQSLNSKLAALNAQRAAFAARESNDKAREQAVAEQEHAARGSRAKVLAMEDRRLKQAENEAKAGQKPLDQQIKDLKSKLAVYGNTGHYRIDCFALDLQYDYQRLPVYDHGRTMN